MKKRFVSTAAALVAFGLNATFAADNAAAPAAPAASAPPPTAAAAAPATTPTYTTEQLLEIYGWFLGRNLQLGEFELSDAEFAALARGIAANAKGTPKPENMEQIGPMLEEFIRTRTTSVGQKHRAANTAEETALFAELDKKEGVKKTESGLRYEIIAPGSDKKPSPNDRVTANYTGKFPDGTVFDSTANSAPVEFSLNGVIVAWKQALPLIGVGGKIKLYVPSKLGYGDEGQGPIPPGKALIFDIELVSFRPEQPQLMNPGQPQLLVP